MIKGLNKGQRFVNAFGAIVTILYFEKSEIDAYVKKATSGDYNNLLCVSMEYVDKCNERVE